MKYGIFIKSLGWYKRRKYRASTPGYLFTNDIEQAMLYESKEKAQITMDSMLIDSRLKGTSISIEEIRLQRVCDGTVV